MNHDMEVWMHVRVYNRVSTIRAEENLPRFNFIMLNKPILAVCQYTLIPHHNIFQNLRRIYNVQGKGKPLTLIYSSCNSRNNRKKRWRMSGTVGAGSRKVSSKKPREV